MRVVRRPLGLAGSAVAVMFFCLSLTPSLLPRSWILQGAVSGVTSAMGYGLGATLGALVHRWWRPVYAGGDTVRFAQSASELRTPGDRWRFPRVAYLQNSSDPVVWWTPQLLYRSPEWLDSPRGPDVSPDMQWYPGVTFWQVVVDLGFSTSVPTGHGHVYGSSVADGWAALLQPPGWTPADTVRLRALLDTR